MITKLVDMVGEKKLSIEQAAELFSVIFPEINLTSTEKARLVGQFFHPEQLNHHQVRIVVSDQQEKNVLAQWTSDLVKVLRGIDRFLGVTLLTRESTEVTYNEGAIRLSLYLERDNEAGNEDAT
ncbi:MAG: hypothetical protein R3E39_08680 [Anaerolineae bacterium]